MRFFRFFLIVVSAASTLAGCSAANYDPTTALGKQAILDSVAVKLSSQDCAGAIAQITPVYNSLNTDNRVRMMMAAADGCAATISLFKLIGDMSDNTSAFSGGGFWAFLATEFPSTFKDDIAEGAQAAQDALESVVDPGTVLLSNQTFNAKSFNPGAYNVNSRTASANAYLFFTAMAAIGSLEARYGAPDSKGKPTASPPLPWNSATAVTADGCAYGAAVVNFIDAVGSLAGNVPGTLASTLTTLQTTFQTAIFAACNQGCTNALVSGCSLSACASCPLTLRDRTSCTGTITDPNSCAVAGIVNFLNTTPGAGWN